MNYFRFGIFARLALILITLGSCVQQKSSPNIILCMADDLGWGDVGYNGNPTIQTPNLDEMAASGIQFNRFYSGSAVCSPTRGSCLTGRNPFRYGIYSANNGHLKEDEVALSEVFKELGYATGHFGKWHLGTMTPDYSGKGKGRHPERNFMTPGMAGFEEWFSTEYAVATYDPYDPNNKHNKVGDPRALYWHNGVNIKEGPEGCDSKIIMDKAIPFIRKSVRKKQPFFTVIWFHAPHAPVVGHPEYINKFYGDYSEDEQHYYSVVTALDAQVGRLRNELKELGVANNTILCFTSDNGPEGNPGKRRKFQGSAKPFRGRKRSLYEGGVRVPGIIEYPARFGQHREIDVPCVTSDYFPTLCELMGLDMREYERPSDGISLWNIMEGEQTQRAKPIGFQFGKQKSLVDDRFKLVNNLGTDRPRSDNGIVPTAEYELYDLVNDPSETKNIIDRHPDVADRMIGELNKWVASCTQSDQGADYQQESGVVEFEPAWESLAKAEPATWWEEGKFGIFIHWGPYSVAGYKDQHKGYAEAITNDMYKRPENYQDFFMEKFGAMPPEFGYKDWVDLYRAEKWDPQSWAKLFKEAGARYVIPTGEHHDGFVNWDSDLTEWCATKKGPMRDLIGDLAKAVRTEGMKFGISYHRERHPSRFTADFKVYDKPFEQVAEEIRKVPESEKLYGPFEYSDAFIADYVARWKEAEEKYRPDFMWLDDVPIFYRAEGDPQVDKFQNAFKGMIADYLNNAQQWGKEVYFNNKGKYTNFPENVGCREKDNLQMDTIGPPWQNPATLGVSYAYMQNEEVKDLYKTPAELVRLLADVVSKNGNLLLNIGPRADGTIPEGMQTRLLAMGNWLKTYGEAIYGTKPWHNFGEYKGEIIEEEGVHYSRHSMRIHETEYRYTSKQDVIYVIAFQPANGEVRLNAFKGFDKSIIISIELLGEGPVEWKMDEQGLTLSPGTNKNFDLACVYKIKTVA